MSSTKTETTLPQSPTTGIQAFLPDARIDAAHSLEGQDSDLMPAAMANSSIDSDIESVIADSAENVSVLAAVEFPKDDLASEQLQRQAEQLAHYLRARQEELDHREAQLNAEIAQLESDLRKARLCLSEREAEQDERRQELDNREKEILERLERLAAADAALKRKPGAELEFAGRSDHLPLENKQLARQMADLKEERRRWEIERQEAENALQYERQQLEARQEASLQLIRQRESQLEKYRAALESEVLKSSSGSGGFLPDSSVLEQTIQRDAALLQQRQQELENAENRLAQAQTDIQTFQEQLTAERRELREEIHQERQRLVAQQRQALAELEKKRRILLKRGKHVDQSRAALLQLRAELQHMHRETLEIRLATEELWIKLSGAAPPAALTQSLARIRNRLAEQYRLANAESLKQKEELESIRDQLVEQYENLDEQKRQFERWMGVRQGETDQQASMLIAREQALLRQQTRFEEESGRWRVERMRYEQEIRRLRLNLARHDKETADV
jgi:hypothetical protein